MANHEGWTANGVTAADAATPGLYAVTYGDKTSREPVRLEDAAHSRVVRLAVTNAPFTEVVGETDADTGTVNLTIGCQTHPIERWKRIGARLVRSHFAHDEKRLTAALADAIKRMEAEFRKK